jgi:hypothetical protein
LYRWQSKKAFSNQQSAISNQQSAFSNQLSAISYQLSVFSFCCHDLPEVDNTGWDNHWCLKRF